MRNCSFDAAHSLNSTSVHLLVLLFLRLLLLSVSPVHDSLRRAPATPEPGEAEIDAQSQANRENQAGLKLFTGKNFRIFMFEFLKRVTKSNSRYSSSTLTGDAGLKRIAREE